MSETPVRPRILVSNDDSYRAEGLRSVVEALCEWAEVSVVAPDRERSGSSHAITLDRPLRLRPLDLPSSPARWYLVDGTPADCVNLGLHVVFPDQPPDLVVTGINHGVNLGNDVTYSGTVGGALEAHNYGVPSVALSQRTDGGFSFERTADIASQLIRKLLDGGLFVPGPLCVLLNVNFPTGEFGQFEVAELGRRVYRDVVASRSDPRGREYYWIAGSPSWDEREGTDVSAVQHGNISITPLFGDLTYREGLSALREVLS